MQTSPSPVAANVAKLRTVGVLRSKATGWAPTALALALAGCGGGGDDGFDFNTGGPTAGTGVMPTTGATGDDSGTSDAGTDAGPTTGMDGSDGPADSGSDGSGDDGPMIVPGEPCIGVDMIFVVDNSETMAEEQARLVGSAAAWVNQVNTNIPSGMDGFHIGVLATDDSTFKTTDGVGTACAFASGEVWMELGPNLGTELACALAQGIDGDPDERPMDNVLDALSDEALMPEGRHEGFLRDDALLVIVLLTDEEDDLEKVTGWGSSGDPAAWVQTLVDRKGGFHQNVVPLSLIGHEPPNACPPFQWDGASGAEIAPRLIEFTESFPAGAYGDICELEYNTFLSSVVTGVASACGNVAS